MRNLNLISIGNKDQPKPSVTCCEKSDATISAGIAGSCCHDTVNIACGWIIGSKATRSGIVPAVSSEWSKTEYMQHIMCRTSAYRNTYTVPPGLYAVGNPDAESDIIVTANYKYSFDIVRRDLKGLDAWILVLDTKGINVWCAAGKGTFGTEELIKRVTAVGLDKVVNHKRLIVPQLGAPGVSGFSVTKRTGFRVVFGPVDSRDIPEFIGSGYKATAEMRKVKFSLFDRLILTPMEINPAMKKFPAFALLVLIIFGLRPDGIIFADALRGGWPLLVMGLLSILSGAFLTPVMLPLIPFRSFAVKGWIVGIATFFIASKVLGLFSGEHPLLLVAGYIFFPALSSYLALQFTGSTTFTSMSGVKREMKIAVPVYIAVLFMTALLLLTFKLGQWGVL